MGTTPKRQARFRTRWTSEDERILEARLAAGDCFETISQALGRSRRAVKMRAFQLGFRYGTPGKTRRRWTAQEVQRLFTLVENGATITEAATDLGRSFYAVQMRLKALGMYAGQKESPSRHGEFWTAEDDQRLRELWDDKRLGVDGIAHALSRAKTAVGARAIKLRLPRRRSVNTVARCDSDREALLRLKGHLKSRLSPEEDLVVRRCLSDGCCIKCICERLGRTEKVVGEHIERYSLDDEPGEFDSVIAELAASGFPSATIAAKLDLSIWAVSKALSRESDSRTTGGRKRRPKNTRTEWSPEDIALLNQLTSDGATFGEVAVRLQRTLAATKRKAASLGVRRLLADHERSLIEERVASGCSIGCIMGRLGRERGTVECYVKAQRLRELPGNALRRIRLMADDGFTTRAIALQLGYSDRSIRAALNDREDRHA